MGNDGEGDRASALNEVAKIVITESVAKKYFGDEDPMGRSLLTAVPGGSEIPMQVTGVIKDVPENAHLKFDILDFLPNRNAIFRVGL